MDSGRFQAFAYLLKDKEIVIISEICLTMLHVLEKGHNIRI
jgi:hypothetical protein